MFHIMKIIFRALVWLLLLSGVLMFQQNQFKAIFERLEVIGYNTSYVARLETHNFKYNRTHAAVNVTFDNKIVFGNELQVELQSYKMASNEYRLFPIRYGFNFCEYAAGNELGLRELFECGNLTGCPLKKGLYRTCNWIPNAQKFPPHIPAGSYMHDVKFYYGSVEVFFLQMYGSIKYPEVKGISFF